jgi:diacylglycerol kinase family enzyme
LGSVSTSRRMCAIVALVAGTAAFAVSVAALLERPLIAVGSIACLSVAIGAAAYTITRTGTRRRLAAVAALLAFLAALALIIAFGRPLLIPVVIALQLIGVGAARYALGRDIASLKSGPSPGDPVPPATRPVLLMNPKSGGGKVERFDLVNQARRRGIEPIVLGPDDDLDQLARDAVARGADVIGMAGGDGSQALVAGVAMRHDVAFVCVPAGTRNHLAMDLGLDRENVVDALDAFGDAVERRVDLAVVGDRVFANNVTMGLYAKIVQSPEYRNRKAGTALDMLPGMLGPGAQPFDLQFTGPDGTDHSSAHLVMVSNGRYDLTGDGFGSRRRVDAGTIGIVAARFRSSSELAKFVQLHAMGQERRFRDWAEWTDTSFEVRSQAPVEVGIDGEAAIMEPPLTFRTIPGALRVRIPRHAPGYSPAAARPRRGAVTLKALLQTAVGRPVTIDA